MDVQMQSAKVEEADYTAGDMRVTAALLTRFADVREFMVSRGVTQYMPVFTAVDPSIGDFAQRLGKVWNGHRRLQPDDEAMISKLEKVVEHLKAA